METAASKHTLRFNFKTAPNHFAKSVAFYHSSTNCLRVPITHIRVDLLIGNTELSFIVVLT